MKKRSPLFSFTVIVIVLMIAAFAWMILTEEPIAIVYPEDTTAQEIFAAREIRRYLYLRTGVLAKLANEKEFVSPFSDVVFISNKDNFIEKSLAKAPELGPEINDLESEHYMITTHQGKWRRTMYIIGGDDIGTLYGAYSFAEHIGVRFYLHGDVVPDGTIEAELPLIEETAQPLFDTRGIQPFHDFPEGPDWWNRDDYKAIIAQLPKLRMNFFGLHTYPEGGPNAEPTVWIGISEDIGENGRVDFSYPSSYQNTQRGNWGYAAKSTGKFVFGGSLLFEHNYYGSDIMLGICPDPKTPEDCNEVFRRTGTVLGDVFRFARSLGVRTCIGTETPLTVPKMLGERLKSAGKDPTDSGVVQEIYEGMFRRIAETTPVDYYWFWTPEGWTWSGNTDLQMKATMSDIGAAIAAKEKINAPFELATCGWVLGPRNDRAFFDNSLPKSMPMSCINRGVGTVAVDRAFARISGRPKWAIPWLEDDPGLTSAQLWVGRMRSDAVDALRYGCTGLLGIHWRTRVLGPNVSALARAAWDQEPWIQKHRVSGALEGHVMTPSSRNIRYTEDDILYQTGRHNMYNCRFEVPDGTYTVTLKFCELEHTKRRARVFDVYIQDEKKIEKLDIFARVRDHRALDLSFEDVKVEDGFLDIIFETGAPVRDSSYGHACISAIEIIGNGHTVKVNCGGPAYRDYAADSAIISRKKVNRDYLNETSQWEYTPARHFDSGDFYNDWALHQFGPEASREISAVFTRMDGAMPRSSDWINGPGGWKPDTTPWEKRAKDYTFVKELEQLRDRISGPGNCERFDYWLNNFRFMRSTAHLCCVWAEFNSAMEDVKVERDAETRVLMARENTLPLYIEMVQLLGETYGHLLAFVSNYGELGTVANVEQHILPGLLTETGKQLAVALGEELPDYALPTVEYEGEPRVIVPTVRSSYAAGETLELKVIVLDSKQPSQAELYWREMGAETFNVEKMNHVARGVYTVQFPESCSPVEDIEYYVKVISVNGQELYFPATAPEMNQTVVMVEGR